mmetsp:Transcript_22997/g.35970  ORF Transcript_22997/g.35970 Transcript_22997/m.35970 type:complete len:97 (+) Transcript_22997:104-394(+)
MMRFASRSRSRPATDDNICVGYLCLCSATVGELSFHYCNSPAFCGGDAEVIKHTENIESFQKISTATATAQKLRKHKSMKRSSFSELASKIRAKTK